MIFENQQAAIDSTTSYTFPTDHLEANELIRVLAVAQEKCPRDHAMFLLAFRHGLRASEIAALRLDDVQGQKIKIRRLKGSLSQEQPLLPDPNPLLDEPAVLATWLAERGDADGSCFLFTSRQGSGVSRRTVYNAFNEVALRAGIERGRRHPHVLKHTLGTIMHQGGAPVEIIRLATGHVDVKNTLRYVHIQNRKVAEVTAEAMNSVFSAA